MNISSIYKEYLIMHFKNKPANEKVHITVKKYNIPQHHHQNSIHISLHHSTTNCILQLWFHVILYHQTEKYKQTGQWKESTTNQLFKCRKKSYQWLSTIHSTYCIHHLEVVCMLVLDYGIIMRIDVSITEKVKNIYRPQ